MRRQTVGSYIYDRVMPRLGGFPQGRLFDPEALYDSTTRSGSGMVRMSLPPGPERDAIMAEMLEALQAGTGNLPTLIDDLRGLIAGRDLTQLINSVVVPATMVTLTGGESLADGDATSTWAAKIEYLVGVALSVDPADDVPTFRAVPGQEGQIAGDDCLARPAMGRRRRRRTTWRTPTSRSVIHAGCWPRVPL